MIDMGYHEDKIEWAVMTEIIVLRARWRFVGRKTANISLFVAHLLTLPTLMMLLTTLSGHQEEFHASYSSSPLYSSPPLHSSPPLYSSLLTSPQHHLLEKSSAICVTLSPNIPSKLLIRVRLNCSKMDE